ncbi:MAG: tyrosine--tRNA ligase [Planctomycetaceae bacterium]|jgi:tyrosyl-tRNA synthetase|nr:tyrosine--tRNA ligase [Planctomycetaceae bacterium]
MKDIFTELAWRGLVYQTTDDANIAKWLMEKSRTVYAGFDPTADSLHVGHLLPLLNLRRFQKFGHRPIALIGGATGMIGDPSGKSAERNLQTFDQIFGNVLSIKKQMRRFLDFDDRECGAILVNNYDWIAPMSSIEFLRDVGKNFSVNIMHAKDSVKSRLEDGGNGLSYTEFSYMVLQSYDFVHLHRTYNCELQIGGSDQWGNITLGCEYGRKVGVPQLYGLTSPLVTKSDGKKMGKTESGALWLDPEKTPPYQFYQYWVNTEDADVEKVLKIFTDLTQDEVAAVAAEHFAAPEKRIAQKRLADEFTRIVHGEEGLAAAQRATQIFFGGEIAGLDDVQLGAIFADVPSKELPRTALEDGLPLTEALLAAVLVPTKNEARRLIQQGGAYVNNMNVRDIDAKLTISDLASETVLVLRSGKKKYALLRFV